MPQSQAQPPGYRFGARDAIFFIAAAVFIYTQVFQLPFTPIYFEGDQLIPVSDAMRMLQGEVIYRDFFHLAPPGTEVFYETMFRIFGVRIWVLNAAIVLLGVGQVGLLWYFSRATLRSYLVFLPAVIYLVTGFRQFGIDGSYRLYSVVFVLAAAAVLVGGSSVRRLFFAGALCGLASFFVQTRGVVGMAGIGAFLMWEHFRSQVDLPGLVKGAIITTAGFLLTVVATQSYFIYQAGAENYYFCLVKFLYAHYPNDPLAKTSSIFSDIPDFNGYLQTYSTIGAVSRYLRFSVPVLFYYLLVPLSYVAFWVYRWRTTKTVDDLTGDRTLVLLSFVGVFLALGVSVPSAGRLYHVAIPSTVLLVFLLSRWSYSKMVLPLVMSGLVLVGIAYAFQRQVAEKIYVDMPGGRAAFFTDDIAERYRWVAEHTKPGDLFYEAQHPSFYFPMHLQNPAPMYLVRDSNYTPPFQVAATVDALARSKPEYVIWQGIWSKEASDRLPGDNLQPMWEFIRDNYEFVVEYIDHGEYTLTSERRIQIWRLKQ